MNADYLKRAYAERGVIHPLPALSSEEVRQVQESYRSLCEPGQALLHKEQRVFGHLVHPWVAQLVAHPAVLRVVRALIGPDVLAWVSEFNTKPPRTQGFFSWHQDLYYWHHRYKSVSTIPIVTVWLAITDATEANGSMRVVPGSHTALLEHTERPDAHNMLTRGQHVAAAIDETKAVHVNLDAGEFSVHHPLLFHASGPNGSDSPRIGLVTRYVSPLVAPAVKPAYTWLVSGEDASGNWDHVAPMDTFTGEALRRKCINAVQASTGARFK
jgi:hypothetical protein